MHACSQADDQALLRGVRRDGAAEERGEHGRAGQDARCGDDHGPMLAGGRVPPSARAVSRICRRVWREGVGCFADVMETALNVQRAARSSVLALCARLDGDDGEAVYADGRAHSRRGPRRLRSSRRSGSPSRAASSPARPRRWRAPAAAAARGAPVGAARRLRGRGLRGRAAGRRPRGDALRQEPQQEGRQLVEPLPAQAQRAGPRPARPRGRARRRPARALADGARLARDRRRPARDRRRRGALARASAHRGAARASRRSTSATRAARCSRASRASCGRRRSGGPRLRRSARRARGVRRRGRRRCCRRTGSRRSATRDRARSTAAIGSAEVGSITSFVRDQTIASASRSASSSTSAMPAQPSRRIENGRSPDLQRAHAVGDRLRRALERDALARGERAMRIVARGGLGAPDRDAAGRPRRRPAPCPRAARRRRRASRSCRAPARPRAARAAAVPWPESTSQSSNGWISAPAALGGARARRPARGSRR